MIQRRRCPAPFSHSPSPPSREVVVHRLPRAEPLRQISPRGTSMHDPEDAVENDPSIPRWSTGPCRVSRHDRFHQRPMLIRELVSSHTRRPPCQPGDTSAKSIVLRQSLDGTPHTSKTASIAAPRTTNPFTWLCDQQLSIEHLPQIPRTRPFTSLSDLGRARRTWIIADSTIYAKMRRPTHTRTFRQSSHAQIICRSPAKSSRLSCAFAVPYCLIFEFMESRRRYSSKRNTRQPPANQPRTNRIAFDLRTPI